MQSVFCYFDEIENADLSVKKIQAKGFSSSSMNSIVGVSSVKNYMSITSHEISFEKTDAFGGEKITGLKKLLGGEQSISLSDTGGVFISGPIATTLAEAAVEESEDGLKKALIDFGILPLYAQRYRDAVYQGGLLFWIRLDDKKVSEAVEILKEFNAHDIQTIPH